MDYKRLNVPDSVKTRDINIISEKTGNIYESVVVCAKRANEINREIKKELTEKLSNYISFNDNLEEIHENKEQIEVSRYFERMPKPALVALEEFLKDEIWYSKKGEENSQTENYSR